MALALTDLDIPGNSFDSSSNFEGLTAVGKPPFTSFEGVEGRAEIGESPPVVGGGGRGEEAEASSPMSLAISRAT